MSAPPAPARVPDDAPGDGAPAEEICLWAADRYGAGLEVAFSGAEDVVVVDLMARTGRPFRAFTLETGRLPDETHAFLDAVEQRYDLRIRRVFPAQRALDALVGEIGYDGFYLSVENRLRCCHVRKVAPLRQALAGCAAWVTGLRRDQAGTRSEIAAVEVDPANGGLVKVNPLATWTHADVWAWIRAHRLPCNPLHDRGYPSIGCAPCTRAVPPGGDLRAGRWWWERDTAAECGMHYGAAARGAVAGPAWAVPAAPAGTADNAGDTTSERKTKG